MTKETELLILRAQLHTIEMLLALVQDSKETTNLRLDLKKAIRDLETASIIEKVGNAPECSECFEEFGSFACVHPDHVNPPWGDVRGTKSKPPLGNGVIG